MFMCERVIYYRQDDEPGLAYIQYSPIFCRPFEYGARKTMCESSEKDLEILISLIVPHADRFGHIHSTDDVSRKPSEQ